MYLKCNLHFLPYLLTLLGVLAVILTLRHVNQFLMNELMRSIYRKFEFLISQSNVM